MPRPSGGIVILSRQNLLVLARPCARAGRSPHRDRFGSALRPDPALERTASARPPREPRPAWSRARTDRLGAPCSDFAFRVRRAPRPRPRCAGLAPRGSGTGALSSPVGGMPAARATMSGLARSYGKLRGRTRSLAVVRFSARSYLRRPLRYDRAGPGTTARARVRPRGADSCDTGYRVTRLTLDMRSDADRHVRRRARSGPWWSCAS